jgi:hypothetical protein
MEQVHTSSLNADELPSTLLSEGSPNHQPPKKRANGRIKESKLRGLLRNPGILRDLGSFIVLRAWKIIG